jgi:hypothetical protein
MTRSSTASGPEAENDSVSPRTDSKKWDLMGLNLTLLLFAGVLPTPRIVSSSWRLLIYRSYPAIMAVVYFTVLTAQCLAVYKFWGDLDAITNNAFTMVGVFMCHIQAAYTVTNGRKILRLVEVLENTLTPQMKTLTSRKEQTTIITATAHQTRQLTWVMFVIVHGMLLSWIVIPLVHKYSQGTEGADFDSGRPSPYFCFIIWLPFEATASPIYEIVYSVQAICFLMSCMYYTSVNTVFMTLIIHTATQFKIVVMSLRDMDELFPVHNVKLEEESTVVTEQVADGRQQDFGFSRCIELNAYFKQCIKHHQAVIRYVRLGLKDFGVGMCNCNKTDPIYIRTYCR